MKTYKIGIIGAGKVGASLGQGWSAAGHDVFYGVRSAAAPPHPDAKLGSVHEAAAGRDIIVLATPWSAAATALAAAGDLSGRVVVDATNPIGNDFSLAFGHTTSGAEQLALLIPGAQVVKAFNTTGFENMADPRYQDHRAVMFLAGDDAYARDTVAQLATALGFEAVSVGGLSRARQLEPLAMLWIRLAVTLGLGRQIAFTILRRHGQLTPFTRKTASPRRIVVAGSGHIGSTLARGWHRAGHKVQVAVRDPGSAEAKALSDTGVVAVSLKDAARQADIVALAVPFAASGQVLDSLGSVAGKVLIDCTNAIGPGFALQFGGDTSSAEELARKAPGAYVVKSFNQQGAEVLGAPRFDGAAATNFVAGDDHKARRTVAELGEDLGLSCIEAGPLQNARLLEPMTILWIAASQALGTREFGLALVRR